ncbi:SIR2 family protein [Vibrio parahaemolyticus]|uniref:SIR2 family protein n=1 Tax=Vibrio parahaemolyticus TaxID=670 RepID=UPI00193FAA73|nr:SIR2 family protein [Vibrio parahaemolyticus]HCG7239833.1 SIR2 family protein [Vibrio parahaemolyticus]
MDKLTYLDRTLQLKEMSVMPTKTVHNPDQYMCDFRHVLTHNKKKIGILIGAGAPVSINIAAPGEERCPLIPDIEGLTNLVYQGLDMEKEQPAFDALVADLSGNNIELVLSRVRSLAEVIGNYEVYGLDARGYEALAKKICKIIKEVVGQELPKGDNPYSHLVSWINGINRDFAVELFTTNYDLLLEEAMERVRTPYFDGFSGSRSAFFDPSSISSNDLPAKWIRLWKLHGSINWATNSKGEVVRGVGSSEGTMVYPSHIKYDQTQSAPFSALFDRLKNFLLEPDTLLLTAGFSFADAHITAKLDECLAENRSSAVFAFQFKTLEEEVFAAEAARRNPNISVYCSDGAVINGVKAPWSIGEPPSKNWEIIRNEYWDSTTSTFGLGDFVSFAKFLASSGGSLSVTQEPLEEKLEGQTNE